MQSRENIGFAPENVKVVRFCIRAAKETGCSQEESRAMFVLCFAQSILTSDIRAYRSDKCPDQFLEDVMEKEDMAYVLMLQILPNQTPVGTLLALLCETE